MEISFTRYTISGTAQMIDFKKELNGQGSAAMTQEENRYRLFSPVVSTHLKEARE